MVTALIFVGLCFLDEDGAAGALVLAVQAADCFEGGAAAGKKIHYEGVFFGAGNFYEMGNKINRLGIIKGVFFAK